MGSHCLEGQTEQGSQIFIQQIIADDRQGEQSDVSGSSWSKESEKTVNTVLWVLYLHDTQDCCLVVTTASINIVLGKRVNPIDW